mmetsp:Transcript_10195/g.32316  ORF Transcript_10195/g.32316 Transcript_10195/m.32316 type:complete len:259 (-) Transcript_10195:962-1738(-)
MTWATRAATAFATMKIRPSLTVRAKSSRASPSVTSKCLCSARIRRSWGSGRCACRARCTSRRRCTPSTTSSGRSLGRVARRRRRLSRSLAPRLRCAAAAPSRGVVAATVATARAQVTRRSCTSSCRLTRKSSWRRPCACSGPTWSRAALTRRTASPRHRRRVVGPVRAAARVRVAAAVCPGRRQRHPAPLPCRCRRRRRWTADPAQSPRLRRVQPPPPSPRPCRPHRCRLHRRPRRLPPLPLPPLPPPPPLRRPRRCP